MRVDNTGDAAGLKVSDIDAVTEMRLYDALPERARRALREASNNISARSAHELLAAGMTARGTAELIEIGDKNISAHIRMKHYGSPWS